MRHARTTTGLLAVVAALAGCGGEGDHRNDPRPPTQINVTAALTTDGITISPRHFGAGPVVLLIANETGRARRVSLETDELGADTPGLRRRTDAIEPNAKATLKVDMAQGRYTLSAGGDAAGLQVGRPRPSSSNELLTP